LGHEEQADGYAKTALPAVLTTLEDFLVAAKRARHINVHKLHCAQLTRQQFVAA